MLTLVALHGAKSGLVPFDPFWHPRVPEVLSLATPRQTFDILRLLIFVHFVTASSTSDIFRLEFQFTTSTSKRLHSYLSEQSQHRANLTPTVEPLVAFRPLEGVGYSDCRACRLGEPGHAFVQRLRHHDPI